MPQLPAEYIEQLEREANEQLPGRTVANLKAQASRSLTSQQILQINSQVNRIPMASFVGYLMYGIINRSNLHLFTQMSSERRDIAAAIISKHEAVPEIPVVPEKPEIPETPENPENPEKPESPETPAPPVPPVAPTSPTDICLLGAPTAVKAFAVFLETAIANTPMAQQFHLLNLPCDAFAAKLADNKDNAVTLDDLGPDAAMQLCTQRPKQVFIVIDATAESIRFNQIVSQTDSEGNVRQYSVHKNVNQPVALRRFVELLSSPECSTMLQNVTTLAVAMIKADTLGDGEQRDHEALRRFRMLNTGTINPLIQLCRASRINAATDGQPLLFTFCAGHSHETAHRQFAPSDISKLKEILKGNIAHD